MKNCNYDRNPSPLICSFRHTLKGPAIYTAHVTDVVNQGSLFESTFTLNVPKFPLKAINLMFYVICPYFITQSICKTENKIALYILPTYVFCYIVYRTSNRIVFIKLWRNTNWNIFRYIKEKMLILVLYEHWIHLVIS